MEEKKRKEERERERDPEEKREERIRRERRRRNLVWRGIEGDSVKERCEWLRVLIEKILGRKAEVRGVEERIGEGGKRLLLVVMEKGEDRDEILGKKGEIWRRWKMVVDEDLTMEERKMKWRIKEKARLERNKGNWVVFDSRRIWIEDREWKWVEEEGMWKDCEDD
ncbi:unnamed protein product [Lasius platythorax]